MGRMTYWDERERAERVAVEGASGLSARLLLAQVARDADPADDRRESGPAQIEWRCVGGVWTRWSPLEGAWCAAEPPDLLVQTVRDRQLAPTEHDRFRLVDGRFEHVIVPDA